jgi:hydrogenase maturation protein HypF
MNQAGSGLKVWVRGIVQGVGFRPFIFTLAERLHLTGWVKNTSAGVEIEVYGAQPDLDAFLVQLKGSPPPLARIDQVEVSQINDRNGYTMFQIIESQSSPGDFLPVSPDVAICPDCTRELFDPLNRRYRYPFINCTNCGPRFSIVRDIPYDRPRTTMANFQLCPDCQEEYENPRDRRFHAQPVACPACGPQVTYESSGDRLALGEPALQMAREALQQGKILAVKGLGGFHLACDASSPSALAELRRRKQRSDKPFALMAFDLQTVREHCEVSKEEAALLTSRQAPVVLLNRKQSSPIVPAAAPGQGTLGFMLPYTPLHLLLLEPYPGYPDVLVMTSGNLSEEPIAYEDGDAVERLGPLADGFLLHNRPIHMRVDDSVACTAQSRPYFVRRSRGYAPDPLPLPVDCLPLLAAGPELKNTFALARDRYAFVSHHIGDMENYETLRSFEEGIAHYERLFRIEPQVIACDMHPNYLATRYAIQRSEKEGLPLIKVQHHHAHMAACLAENGWTSAEPVIGLSFDGTGYGSDGAIWGGEVLVGGYTGYQRRFHLDYVPLPGGDAGVRKPARMALAHLWAAGIDWEPDLPPVSFFCAEDRTILKTQLERKINTPLTSSMGRLFDAASALVGVRQSATYEGQAAIELEAITDPSEMGYYSIEIHEDLISPAFLWQSMLDDWRSGTSTPIIAARFHNSITRMALDVCQTIRRESGCQAVALSGGVWQNRFLLERAAAELSASGFQVLLHRWLPPNDGCIAYGQVMAACQSI